MWSEDTKHAVLLPPNSKFLALIVMDTHKRSKHYGVRLTLAKLRISYWLPHGYSQVKRILTECSVCQKVEGGLFRPPRMAQLPVERVQRSPAFKYTGLDYMGPIKVTEKPGEEHQKRRVALFTCFSTRAVHLELVQNCSSDSVIKAVTRFITHRGTPAVITTDNATQFKSAGSSLSMIWADKPDHDEALLEFYTREGITWRTIPECTPWVGGLYETLVGLVKKKTEEKKKRRGIKKTFWKLTVDEETLTTLLTQIEGILNCRPLLSLRSEPDYSCLTYTHHTVI